MNIIDFLKNLFSPKIKGPGLLEDNRSKEEKSKDFLHSELAMFGSVTWKEKKPDEWVKYPIRNQDGSSSCVFFAVSKALGIENYLEEGEFVNLSPRDGYSQRFNKPEEGSYYYDAFNLAINKGFTLETLMPSENKGEAIMNDAKDRKTSYSQIARVFRAGGYVFLDKDSLYLVAWN